MPHYALGLDYGTASVRGLLVNTENGDELATAVYAYPHGVGGTVTDPRDPDLARQHPQDYLDGAETVIKGVLTQAAETVPDFLPAQVAGIGVDTTGSTPLPVNSDGVPLALTSEWADNPAALVYLWKDHTGHAEAAEITALAQKMRPQYLAKCGGTYSAEWFWAKTLHCLRADPDVYSAAHTWVEHADWLPAVLTGTTQPQILKRGICAAGHKAFYHPRLGRLARCRVPGGVRPAPPAPAPFPARTNIFCRHSGRDAFRRMGTQDRPPGRTARIGGGV